MAFTAPPLQHPRLNISPQRPIREITIVQLNPNTLQCRIQGRTTELPFSLITAVGPGRIDRTNSAEAKQLFHMGALSDPAHLLAIHVQHHSNQQSVIYIIIGASCRWNDIFPNDIETTATNVDHLIHLTELLITSNTNIEYIQGKGPVGARNIPIYETMDSYLRHLQKSIPDISREQPVHEHEK